MAYDGQDLTSDERVVYRTYLHWIVLVPSFALGGVLIVVGVIAATRPRFLDTVYSGGGNHLLVLGYVLVIAGLCVAAGGVLRRISTALTVTTRRVTISTGIALRRSLEILLSKVESIEVEQTLIGRLLDYGSIVVRGTGGTPEPIQMIGHPLDFRRQVQNQIESQQQRSVRS
jgi:uncharacterized membrane protein YdbT with pleckstrin-like domain